MATRLGSRITAHWLTLHALALLSATLHAVVDWHIGLFGPTSSTLSLPQAGVAVGMSLVTALWALGLAWAARDEARGHVTVLIVALLWGFLGNGLVIAACPPPCADGFPYQDLSHVGSLVFGAAASWASWRRWRASRGDAGWLVPASVLAVITGLFALQAFLAP